MTDEPKDTELDKATREWDEYFFGPKPDGEGKVVIDGKEYTIRTTGSKFYSRRNGQWVQADAYVRRNGAWVPVR